MIIELAFHNKTKNLFILFMYTVLVVDRTVDLYRYSNSTFSLPPDDDFHFHQVEILDPVSSLWRFIRIAHLHVDPDAEVMLGLYAAAPTDKGGSVHFNYLKYSHTEGIEHDNK